MRTCLPWQTRATQRPNQAARAHAAVEAAMVSACAQFKTIGAAFVSAARDQIVAEQLPDGMQLEQRANGTVAPLRTTLESALQAHAPAADDALLRALTQAKRVL